ncbi:hypothetical protein EDB83DRAFT_287856 [Lactarius deliciosus]|nr:hypothetical protein EDB83DRAFT_287856 [Lactarius deliciosus]
MHVWVSELKADSCSSTPVYPIPNTHRRAAPVIIAPVGPPNLFVKLVSPSPDMGHSSFLFYFVCFFAPLSFPVLLVFKGQKNTMRPYLNQASDQVVVVCPSQFDYRNFMAPCSLVSQLHVSFSRATKDRKPSKKNICYHSTMAKWEGQLLNN